MNSAKPPRLAESILQEFGPELNQEALAGDLNEAFQQGRSKGWYWRQVLGAVQRRRLLRPLLFSVYLAWWMTSPWMNQRPVMRRPVLVAVLTAAYFASLLAPGIKRRRLKVLLVLLITATVGLLWYYKPDLSAYWVVLWIVAANFVVERKARGRTSHPVTLRELVFGDPDAERQRLLEKLHLAMLQETDPQVCHAYAEAIAALNRELPAAKATQ